jgi:hypothetical protein
MRVSTQEYFIGLTAIDTSKTVESITLIDIQFISANKTFVMDLASPEYEAITTDNVVFDSMILLHRFE